MPILFCFDAASMISKDLGFWLKYIFENLHLTFWIFWIDDVVVVQIFFVEVAELKF
jgi:hypothetical protein